MSDDTIDDAPPAKKQRYVRLNLSQSNINRRAKNFKQIKGIHRTPSVPFCKPSRQQ